MFPSLISDPETFLDAAKKMNGVNQDQPQSHPMGWTVYQEVQCHSLDGGVYDSLLDRSSWLLLDPRWPTCCIQNEGAALCIKSICEQIYIAHMYTTAHALS